MPFVKKAVLDKLLRDDSAWQELLVEYRSEGIRLGREAAEAQVSSLETELASSRAENVEHAERITQLVNDLDEANNLLGQALSNSDTQARSVALAYAVQLTSAGIGIPSPAGIATQFLAFLRGDAQPEIDQVNAGWNSLIEYLIQDSTSSASDSGIIWAQDPVAYLEGLRR